MSFSTALASVPAKTAYVYAGLGFLVGALTQVLQVALAASTAPIQEPSKWAVSAGAGILAAGVAAALPWLRAALPEIPVPVFTPIKKVSKPRVKPPTT